MAVRREVAVRLRIEAFRYASQINFWSLTRFHAVQPLHLFQLKNRYSTANFTAILEIRR